MTDINIVGPKDLNMKDASRAYLGAVRNSMVSFPYEYYIYSIAEGDTDYERSEDDDLEILRIKPYREVLDWCCDNTTARWSYMFIQGLTDMRPTEGRDKEIFGDDGNLAPTTMDKMQNQSHGSYIKHLKVMFEAEEDSVHFKLRWE